MPIANVNLRVSVSSGNLNLPVTAGLSTSGYWYVYNPVDANNSVLGASIKPYKWADSLAISGGFSNLAIEGTIALVTENWEGANVEYHGGTVDWIGAGVNDITAAVETDAFFFNHLGSLSAADDAFYWDRAFDDGTGEWSYYQYHRHLPTSYVQYKNGRSTTAGRGFVHPTDKAFASLISNRVTVMGTDYVGALARIHTPSVGGAHNSHNDVNMATVSTKNYLTCGILKGNDDRYHGFYTSANGAQWDLYSRSYLDSSQNFTAEAFLGTYDFADPLFVPVSNQQSQYPFRASCGISYGSRIYVPVITNNAVSGFDLEIFSYTSADTIAIGTLQRNVLFSGVAVRPDCVLKVVGSKIYAVITDVAAGGVRLFSFDGTTWTNEGVLLTNSNTKYVRVHGLEFNSSDARFYVLCSGTALGGGTYAGPGLYSFEVTGIFGGYDHLDFDASNYQFTTRNALSAGHLKYDKITGVLTRDSATEPQAIGSDIAILQYDVASPEFFNRKEYNLRAEVNYYQGLVLSSSRKLAVGRIVGNEGNRSERKVDGDLLGSFISEDGNTAIHLATGGTGDDYITGIVQDEENNKLWFTGYTKSRFVQNKDYILHGFNRTVTDGTNLVQWKDSVVDSTGNIITVGYHSDNYAVAAKWDFNYELLWMKQIGGYGSAEQSYGVDIDSSGNIYIAASTSSGGLGSSNGLLVKLSSAGSLLFARAYGDATDQYISSVCVFQQNSTTLLALSVVSLSALTTTLLITTTDGTILEQNVLSNTLVRRVRKNVAALTVGQFVFVGDGINPSNPAETRIVFGLAQREDPVQMVKWLAVYGDYAPIITGTDVRLLDVVGSTQSYVISGTEGTSGLVVRVNVTEAAGVYTPTKQWTRTFINSSIDGLLTTPLADATKFVYCIGYTTASGIATMGMNDGLIAKIDSSGAVVWQNAFGHDMDERFTSINYDVLGSNLLVTGWSESHATGRNAFLFRCPSNGHATGNYHLEGNPGIPYFYNPTVLSTSTSAELVTSPGAPSNSTGSLTFAVVNPAFDTYNGSVFNYDGSFGVNGTFQFFIASVDTEEVQAFLNSSTFLSQAAAGKNIIYITDELFTFYQAGVVGDGTADDGNFFGYDIIKGSNGKIYVAAQTSGDVSKTSTGPSGAYDYVLVEFNPLTHEMNFYQNGTDRDEEIYSLTQMNDGRIAYVGRTTGNLGGANLGGYDIFLGIFDPNTHISEYYSAGTGLDDKAFGVHDLGDGNLAVCFLTFGTIGPVSQGSADIGVIKFNYTTDVWGDAYQTGSATSENIEQQGTHSILLEDKRIAIVTGTSGVFADDQQTYGLQDIGVGVLDTVTGEWKKFSVGSGASDIPTSVDAIGDKLFITGYAEGTFVGTINGITVEFDAARGVGAKSAVE